jgi:signal transduction histidine kinase
MVTVHLEDLGPGGLRVTVVDTGPALPDSSFAELRSRLQPGEGSVRSGRHGLGLHIATEIARALGAEVGLDGGPDGRGLSVRVNLPARAG